VVEERGLLVKMLKVQPQVEMAEMDLPTYFARAQMKQEQAEVGVLELRVQERAEQAEVATQSLQALEQAARQTLVVGAVAD
jgi:uncharacterized membrane protein